MKLYFFLYCLLFFVITSPVQTRAKGTDNPFLKEWNTPFKTPPFNEIKSEHYLPAFEEGIKQQRAEIDAIVNSKERPTFKNTIEAMEKSGSLLTRVNRVFFALNSANSNDEMQKLAEKITSLLTKHVDDIYLNEKLFNRVKAVYNEKDNLKLSTEQKTVLENYYLDFTTGGANLSNEGKDKLRKINDELAQLVLKFGDNVRKENSKFELAVDNKEDLKGLPDISISAASEKANAKGLTGKWIFTIDKPTLLPFLQYSEKRDLRERMYKAYMSRGNNNDELDNKKIFSRIVSLRVEKANLLGYKRYADLVLQRKMAKTPENVIKFLNDMWTPTLKKTEAEVSEMQKIIDAEGATLNYNHGTGGSMQRR